MKNARFYVAFTFILFGLLCFGCSNAANDAGGENKNISASQVDGGISVTVDVPEGMPILEFYRTKKGEGYRDNWYTIENAISGQTISVIDYYCEADSNYTYWVQYLNKDWVYQKSSDEIEITSSKKGFTPPSVSNSPKATFNSETNKLDFSVIPEFANIQSQITGYQKVKYEFLYQCENDSKWECICEFNKGDSSTKPLYDWILTRHSGHKLKYHSFKVRFVSDDGKSNYGFNIGKEAAIGDIDFGAVVYTCICGCNTSTGIQKQTVDFIFNNDKTFSVVMDGSVGTTGTYTGNPAANGRVVATVLNTVADDDDYTNYSFSIDISDGRFLVDGMGEFVTSKTFTAVYYYYSMASGGKETEDNIAFFSDGTFSVYEEIEVPNAQGEHEPVFSEIVGRGEYTGNPATDGTVNVTILQMMNNEGTSLESLSEPQIQTLYISNKQFQSTSGGNQIVTYTRVYPE